MSLSPKTMLALWVSCAVCACATVPKVEGPPPPRPEERSSLDMLLRHRSELSLTEEQVAKLEQLDEQREADTRTLRDQLAARRKERLEGKSQGGGAGPASSNAMPPGMSSRGMGGGGRGMGGMGGMGGRNTSVRPKDPNEFERVMARIDEADTRSFLDGMEALTEAQRPTAEKLATDYRSRLYDYREAMRKREPTAEVE